MEIVCPACQARFALRTEKLPKTPFKVACGKCRHQFTIDPQELLATIPNTPPGGVPAEPAPPPQAPPPQPAPKPPAPIPQAAPAPRPAPPQPPAPPPPSSPPLPPQAGSPTAEIVSPPVEEFSEDLHLALVCDDIPERREQVSSALRALGYKVHAAPSPREVIPWIYQNKYEVVLVHEEFGRSNLAQNEALAGLRRLQMGVRRTLCVGLYGRSFRTLDNMSSFHQSVNFVIAERDLTKAESVIRTAVADNDTFYRVFKETLKRLGKV